MSATANSLDDMKQTTQQNSPQISQPANAPAVNWQNNPVGAVFAREGGTSPEGTFRLTSDGIEVYTLISSPQTEFYQPASLFYGDNNADKERVDALAPSGKVASSMNCFFVRANGHNILIDTGLPESRSGMTVKRLASLGVNPESISRIYITHSHFDHIGGLLDETGNAIYPAAEVYISSREMAFMEGSMAEFTSQLKQAYGDRLIVFEPGELLPDGFLAIDAPGHTPGHVVYRIGNLLFAGDILHGMALQLVDPEICANFDADKALAIRSRRNILEYAAANSLTVLAAHVPNNGVIF